jgi:hypothetical protein
MSERRVWDDISLSVENDLWVRCATEEGESEVDEEGGWLRMRHEWRGGLARTAMSSLDPWISEATPTLDTFQAAV